MHFPWSLAPDARVIIFNAPGSFIAEDPNVDRVSIMGGGGSHDFLNHFGLLDGKILSSDGRVSVGYTEQSRQFGEWLVDIEVLAIGRGLESGEEFPVVWTVKHPNAKIVCNTLGHDEKAHNLPAYNCGRLSCI